MKKTLFLFALIALLALPARAVTPRDTVYVSDTYTTYLALPSPVESFEASDDGLVTVSRVTTQSRLLALHAVSAFGSVETLTVEDATGAYRVVAVVYAKSPENVITDITPGSPRTRRMADLPVMEVTRSKKLKITVPAGIAYFNAGAPVLTSEFIGEARGAVTVKATAAFSDPTNLAICDALGTMHLYLVQYKKSIRTTTITLKADIAAPAPAPVEVEPVMKAARDTVYVTKRHDVTVFFPTSLHSVEVPQGAPLSATIVKKSPWVLEARATDRFDSVVTAMAEDSTGAYRPVALAYAERPTSVVRDLRRGAPGERLAKDVPVVDATRSKTLTLILPAPVAHFDASPAGKLITDITGEDRSQVTVKAAASFKDTVALTIVDAAGAAHPYLVRYAKSIKIQKIDLRPAPSEKAEEAPASIPAGDAAFATVVLDAPAAPVAAARDTLCATASRATHVIFPSGVKALSLQDGAPLTAVAFKEAPSVVEVKASAPFAGVVTMMAEDSTGGYRPVAVVYDEDPDVVVRDLRRGSPQEKKMKDLPVVDITAKKTFSVVVPGRIAHLAVADVVKVSGTIYGENDAEVVMKAPKAFKDLVVVSAVNDRGEVYSCLARYAKGIKTQKLDLRPASEAKPAEPLPPAAPPVVVVARHEAAPPTEVKEDVVVTRTVVTRNEDKSAKVKNEDDAFSASILAAGPVKAMEPERKAEAAPVAQASSGGDTVFVSDIYTTHMIFSTEINYADLSNQTYVAAKIIEGSKNKLALKARSPFAAKASVSVEEADGTFHTYIVAYKREPGALIIDKRPGAENFDMTKIETVEVSDKYTTHLIFATDIGYADLSRPGVLTGKLVDQGKNKLALMARGPFDGHANVSVEEANGVFHTYLLRYAETPRQLVFDTREETAGKGPDGAVATEVNTGSKVTNSREKEATARRRPKGVSANSLKRGDAPLLSEVIEMNQLLYHTAAKNYKLTFMCENIFSYSDITYFVLSLKNDSGISYETGDAVFVLESSNGIKRKIVYESNIFPKNRFGKLTTAAHSEGKVAYSFDKITLSKDQVLKVYLYESNGSRNLVLTLTAKDINGAVEPF